MPVVFGQLALNGIHTTHTEILVDTGAATTWAPTMLAIQLGVLLEGTPVPSGLFDANDQPMHGHPYLVDLVLPRIPPFKETVWFSAGSTQVLLGQKTALETLGATFLNHSGARNGRRFSLFRSRF